MMCGADVPVRRSVRRVADPELVDVPADGESRRDLPAKRDTRGVLWTGASRVDVEVEACSEDVVSLLISGGQTRDRRLRVARGIEDEGDRVAGPDVVAEFPVT